MTPATDHLSRGDAAFAAWLGEEARALGLDAPLNPEAAHKQAGVNILGKLLGAVGLDASGARGRTTWGEALDNTISGPSLLNFLQDVSHSASRLATDGYRPGKQDEQGVQDAAVLASLPATGGFALPKPAGSIGTFGGRLGAEQGAKAGRGTALKALDLAESMERRGESPQAIREATNALIEAADPALGGISKGKDGKWRFEIDDSSAKFRSLGPEHSTLGKELSHPELYAFYPELKETPIARVPGKGGSYQPGARDFGVLPEISVGREAPSRRSVALHEAGGHGVQDVEGFAPGGAPDKGFSTRLYNRRVDAARNLIDRAPLSPEDKATLAAIRNDLKWIYNLSDFDAYTNLAGEAEARNVQARADYTPAQRRAIDPESTEDVPRNRQIVTKSDGGPALMAERIPWTEGRIAQMETLRTNGATIQEIADALGTTPGAINVARQRFGLPKLEKGAAQRTSVWTKERLAELEGARAEGETLTDLAQRFGTTPGAVSQARFKHGLPPMPKEASGRPRSWTDTRLAQMQDVLREGHSLEATASRLGVSLKALKHARRRYTPQAERPAKEVAVGRGRPAETLLDHEAMKVERDVRAFEGRMRKDKHTDAEIADAINKRYGGNVTADDIARGNVWWRVGEDSPHGGYTVPYEDWMQRSNPDGELLGESMLADWD